MRMGIYTDRKREFVKDLQNLLLFLLRLYGFAYLSDDFIRFVSSPFQVSHKLISYAIYSFVVDVWQQL